MNASELPPRNIESVDRDGLQQLATAVIDIERAALDALKPRIDQTFLNACQCLLACQGRVVVCGIGKSGHIGAKFAATLASTGTPAFFVHAAEASHGDLGMMQPGDVVIAISYSGSSNELLALIPGIKRLGIPLIALCGAADSALSQAANLVLDISVEREACPLGLAPTASTTATLVMSDALAIALLSARGFSADDFARSHPGGRLGRRLLLHVADVMHAGDALPSVLSHESLANALLEISKKGLGLVTVVDADNVLVGLFTDGDLRRTLETGADVRTSDINTVMTPNCHTITADALAVSAVEAMQHHKITALPVVNEAHQIVGIVTMHALLASGVV